MLNDLRRALFAAASIAIALCLWATIIGAGQGSAASARILRVGMVVLPGTRGTLATSPIAGVRRAVRELGVQAIVLTPTVREGFAPSFTTLGREGYDLVFGLGFQMAPDAVRVAPQFPHTRFVLIDVSTQELAARPPNLLGLVFQEQQIGYLAGYLAALMEDRRTGRHVVSTVGGLAIPPVDRFIAGFRAGARRADPRIALLNNYSNDFADTARCKRVALGQIARGSGVVFQVAGGCGLGALAAARDKGVWGIGVDTDQSSLGPHILTSAIKRWDRVVFETIRSLGAGTLPSHGDRLLTLDHGELALGKVSPRVPRSYLSRLQSIRSQVIDGRIRDIPGSLRVR